MPQTTLAAARYTGLTWDHPRGYEPLAAAARIQQTRDGAPLITWHTQPLSGFEEHPIADLAARYDLLVLDHPHIGEAVDAKCLTPLEDHFHAADIAAWRQGSVGHAMASYCWAGKHWALPIDVAAQVSAYRPDRLAAAPRDWDEVVAVSERNPVALSLAGPHAFLSLLSICAALGAEPAQDDALLPTSVALEALGIMSRIDARAPSATRVLNPIGLLQAMASGADLALVPLVFGYVNYAVPQAGQWPVAFAQAPLAYGGKRHGSVLGGTGIALTARAEANPSLIEHLRGLMSQHAQVRFFPSHQGQPSARAAWIDPEVNARWNNFYAATLDTVETALLRPRHDGYIAFQAAAAALIRAGLATRAAPALTLEHIRQAWRTGRQQMLTTTLT